MNKPKLWRYALAFIILVLFWVVTLELLIKPRFLNIPGFPILKKLGIYLLPPLLAVSIVYALRYLYVQKKLRQQEQEQEAAKAAEEHRIREEEERQAAILERKRFSLEILSVGVSVEYLRQTQIWDELQSRDTLEPILSPDPEDYPSTLEDKEIGYRERESEVLEHTLGWLNNEWAIPVFLAGPALHNPQMQAIIESNLTEALAHGEVEGRRLSVVESLHDDTPDQLLQKVFDFMERHTEVPAVILVAEDGQALRHYLRAEDSPELLYDGPRPQDAITETVVAFLLGRKDRIEPMRAFIQCDAKSEDPMKPYWEKEQLSRFAKVFTTTEWVPSAWSKALVERFSKLPVIARLQRPQFAHFDGQSAASRARSMKEAWKAALESLEEGGKNQHLFYDFGEVDEGRRIVPLSRAMAGLDPEFDIIDQGINLHRSIGDTGAACPFLGMALASMASYSERGVSSSVFLRREEGASVFMISPLPETDGQADNDPFKTEDEHAEI